MAVNPPKPQSSSDNKTTDEDKKTSSFDPRLVFGIVIVFIAAIIFIYSFKDKIKELFQRLKKTKKIDSNKELEQVEEHKNHDLEDK